MSATALGDSNIVPPKTSNGGVNTFVGSDIGSVDLTPTPEMQASARVGLRTLSGSGAAVPQGVVDRAKRIARGVRLEPHHVTGMVREHERMLQGQTVGGNLSADAHHQQDIEHLLRGGTAGADWASKKLGELSEKAGTRGLPFTGGGSEQQNFKGKPPKQVQGDSVFASHRPFVGMSLDDARYARRLQLDLEPENFAPADDDDFNLDKRASTFTAAHEVKQAARALGKIWADTSPTIQQQLLEKAKGHLASARQSLPSGHPESSMLDNAVTAVGACAGYPINGLDKSLDNLGDRILTLDPDFDGDNDLGPEGDEGGDNVFDSGNDDGFDEDAAEDLDDDTDQYLSEGSTALDVAATDAVKCPECGHPNPHDEDECMGCGHDMSDAIDLSDGENLDVAAAWSDEAREAAIAARRAHEALNSDNFGEARGHMSEATKHFADNTHPALFHLAEAHQAASELNKPKALKHIQMARQALTEDRFGDKTDKAEDKFQPGGTEESKHYKQFYDALPDGPNGGKIHGGVFGNKSVALLPTSTRINPHTDEGEYAEPGKMTHHIIQLEGGQLRDVTGHGGPSMKVGDRIHAHHDQSFGRLTGYSGAKVVGVKLPTGETQGNVPNKKIPHWIYK